MGENYEVRIAGIETVSFSLSPKPKDYKGELFNYDMTEQLAADADKSHLFVKVNINIRDGEKTDTIGHFSLLIIFELKNFNESIIYDAESNTFEVPDDLDFHMRTLVLSSARGAMHSIFKGTYLHGATLPIIGNFPKLKEIPRQ